MYRFLKTIFIVFLFVIGCLYSRETLAWQSGDSTLRNQASYDSDTLSAPAEDDAQASVETEASPEAIYSYNEAHFYEADTLPPSTAKRNISDATWQKMISDPAFKYEDEKPEPQKVQEPGWLTRIVIAAFEFLTSSAGKIIIIALVVLLVLALVFRIFHLNGNIFFVRKDKTYNSGEADAADHVPDDWEKEIHAAAQAGNYRLALRYSYRYLLTVLQEKELIQFQIAKTNYQYVYELKGTPFHKPVMQLTRDYEYAWYGGFDIERPFFENYQQLIQNIKKELNY